MRICFIQSLSEKQFNNLKNNIMENISLWKTIEIWSFTINEVFFEVHLDSSGERLITAIYREDNKDASDEERAMIKAWVLTIDNI